MNKKYLILVALFCALALCMTGCMPSRTTPVPTQSPAAIAPTQIPVQTMVPEATTVPSMTEVPTVTTEPAVATTLAP